jgi:endonuclease/exonuclease/phosphatase (EEP) superfamily protein YafD
VAAIVLFTAGTMGSLATIFGFFGATWWGWDRIADWRFPLMVVLGITAIVYGLAFRKGLSAVFLLAAIVNAVLLAPMWLSTQAGAVSTDRIRIVSLDIGGSGDPREDIVAWIDSVEADLALLYRSTGDWVATIAIQNVPYRVVPTPVGADALGQAIVLVRGDAVATPLPPVPGSDVTIHISLGSTEATVVGVAVRNPGSSNESESRLTRFEAISKAVLGIDESTVVTGNFEASRWSHAFGVIANGMTNSENGFGYAATWPSTDWALIGTYAGLPVDHAVYRGDVTVTTRRVGPNLGPAHRPLLFDVSPAIGED